MHHFIKKILYLECIDDYIANSNSVGKLAQLTLGVG